MTDDQLWDLATYYYGLGTQSRPPDQDDLFRSLHYLEKMKTRDGFYWALKADIKKYLIV